MLDSNEGFRYVKTDSKSLTKSLKEDDQDSDRKGRSPVDRLLRNPYWQSERRL